MTCRKCGGQSPIVGPIGPWGMCHCCQLAQDRTNLQGLRALLRALDPDGDTRRRLAGAPSPVVCSGDGLKHR